MWAINEFQHRLFMVAARQIPLLIALNFLYCKGLFLAVAPANSYNITLKIARFIVSLVSDFKYIAGSNQRYRERHQPLCLVLEQHELILFNLR